MPIFDIIVLGVIVAVFAAFAVVLSWATWYCSDKRKRPIEHDGRRDYGYPSGHAVMTDD
jgi:hypothetical protein